MDQTRARRIYTQNGIRPNRNSLGTTDTVAESRVIANLHIARGNDRNFSPGLLVDAVEMVCTN